MKHRYLLGALFLALLIGIAYWLFRPARPSIREYAHVSERRTSIWNRLATVREPVGSLRYGERVGIIESKQWNNTEFARVMTQSGASGWMEAKQLMSADIWDRAAANLQKSKSMPRQARGITKVPTNLRVEPGRAAPRSFQFGRDVPVEILSRAVAELPPDTSAAAKKAEEQAAEPPAGPRREDWLFIRGQDPDAGELAGWVLGRFLELDLPAPLRDYAAGIHFVAWFELNHVPAKPASENESAKGSAEGKSERMPQYLAAGVTGGEGQPCDFTLLRFYTWNAARRRHETAYVESNFCARLPIRVTPIPAGANPEKSEASFSFVAAGKSGEETREYRMNQNIIRRLRAKK